VRRKQTNHRQSNRSDAVVAEPPFRLIAAMVLTGTVVGAIIAPSPATTDLAAGAASQVAMESAAIDRESAVTSPADRVIEH